MGHTGRDTLWFNTQVGGLLLPEIKTVSTQPENEKFSWTTWTLDLARKVYSPLPNKKISSESFARWLISLVLVVLVLEIVLALALEIEISS